MGEIKRKERIKMKQEKQWTAAKYRSEMGVGGEKQDHSRGGVRERRREIERGGLERWREIEKGGGCRGRRSEGQMSLLMSLQPILSNVGSL